MLEDFQRIAAILAELPSDASEIARPNLARSLWRWRVQVSF
jgi:hypothetical protein